MKTSVIEVHDIPSVLTVDKVEKRKLCAAHIGGDIERSIFGQQPDQTCRGGVRTVVGTADHRRRPVAVFRRSGGYPGGRGESGGGHAPAPEPALSAAVHGGLIGVQKSSGTGKVYLRRGGVGFVLVFPGPAG